MEVAVYIDMVDQNQSLKINMCKRQPLPVNNPLCSFIILTFTTRPEKTNQLQLTTNIQESFL